MAKSRGRFLEISFRIDEIDRRDPDWVVKVRMSGEEEFYVESPEEEEGIRKQIEQMESQLREEMDSILLGWASDLLKKVKPEVSLSFFGAEGEPTEEFLAHLQSHMAKVSRIVEEAEEKFP